MLSTFFRRIFFFLPGNTKIWEFFRGINTMSMSILMSSTFIQTFFDFKLCYDFPFTQITLWYCIHVYNTSCSYTSIFYNVDVYVFSVHIIISQILRFDYFTNWIFLLHAIEWYFCSRFRKKKKSHVNTISKNISFL